ncbi:MAG: FecR domain-containing protein [Prevotellaceae bacterium]|jgi:ferric-dicitrate binding protein FerR (iron transport regulator)|nr:FecR domain-containing protein [Prevotellaceae bacterium]
MQPSKYTHYSAIDFLKDEHFLTWQLFREESDKAYWQQVMADCPDVAPAIMEAETFYRQHVKWNDFKIPPYEIIERLALLQGMIRQKKAQHRRRRIALGTSAAAAVAAGLVAGVTLLFTAPTPQPPPLAGHAAFSDSAFIESKEITLIVDHSAMVLSNNSQVSYTASGAIAVHTEHTNGEALIREPITATQQNKLIVPKGRRSSIILADNTHVWLNSGTTLIFPSSFERHRREIYVDGEIYIEVEKDATRPFIVKSSALNIEVLGTKFNVSAYSSDVEQTVVLVEGSVEIAAGLRRTRLFPNQRFSTDNKGGYEVDEVTVTDYTSWRHGWIQTNTTSLEELARRLSRYYDKEIICDTRVAHLKCYGKLVLFDDLDKALHTVSKNMNIEYRYTNNKTIMLYPKK